jgi:hypothetical protein
VVVVDIGKSNKKTGWARERRELKKEKDTKIKRKSIDLKRIDKTQVQYPPE